MIVYLRLLDDTNQTCSTSSWHIMVQSREYVLSCLVEKNGVLFERPVHAEVAVSLVALHGVKSAHLFGGLHSHEHVTEFVDFEASQSKEADYCFRLYAVDGASPNFKYINYYHDMFHPKDLTMVTECVNHNQAVIEGSCTAVVGGNLQCDLFCAISFLNMSQHFSRGAASTQQLVRDNSKVSPDIDTQWVDLEELAAYAVTNHGVFQQASKSTSVIFKNHNVTKTASIREVEERWSTLRQLVRVSNTGMYSPNWGENTLHSHADSRWCMTEKISIALKATAFAKKPPVPAKNKWTLLCPALDFWVLAFTLGIYRCLGKSPWCAWNAFSADGTVWHQVAGSYLNRMNRFVTEARLWIILVQGLPYQVPSC